MGGPIPTQVSQGCLRKASEQTIVSKPVSSFPPWFRALLLFEFLSRWSLKDGLWWELVCQINPFLSQTVFGQCFITGAASRLEQEGSSVGKSRCCASKRIWAWTSRLCKDWARPWIPTALRGGNRLLLGADWPASLAKSGSFLFSAGPISRE